MLILQAQNNFVCGSLQVFFRTKVHVNQDFQITSANSFIYLKAINWNNHLLTTINYKKWQQVKFQKIYCPDRR
jgi:hypothetical protein